MSAAKPDQRRLNLLDRLIAQIDPVRAVHRAVARQSAGHLRRRRALPPAQVPHRHAKRQSAGGEQAADVRAQARYLERNHDIARGILRTMVNNIVGPEGVTVEFQPRRADAPSTKSTRTS